jgi:hypothetical protein
MQLCLQHRSWQWVFIIVLSSDDSAPNGLQGIGEFGGQVGQVEGLTPLVYKRLTQVPWGVGTAPAPAAPAPAPAAPAPAPVQSQWTSTTTYMAQPTPTPYMTGDGSPNSVGGIPNLGEGTVIPLGTNAASTDPSPQATAAPQDDSSSTDSSSSEPNGGFEANGQLGGDNGK